MPPHLGEPHHAVAAVVFDFGGVLISPITEKLELLATRHGTTMHTLLALLLGPRDSGEHPWHRCERGEIPVDAIQGLLDPWAAAAGIALTGDEIEVLLHADYRIVEPMVNQVATLRARGIRTALLTNTFAEFRPIMQRDLDFGLFDAVVESFAVGARKPEPAIYAATAAALGVPHEQIVYLDDFDQNLVPAQQLGWRTIHVTSPQQALGELAELMT
jgi:epoxide hydrolase-like predicted phosphatase